MILWDVTQHSDHRVQRTEYSHDMFNLLLPHLLLPHRGQMLLSISVSGRTSSPVGSAPGLRIWILRVGRSVHASVTARLPSAARTFACGLFTAETCCPSPPYSLLNLPNPGSLCFNGGSWCDLPSAAQ